MNKWNLMLNQISNILSTKHILEYKIPTCWYTMMNLWTNKSTYFSTSPQFTEFMWTSINHSVDKPWSLLRTAVIRSKVVKNNLLMPCHLDKFTSPLCCNVDSTTVIYTTILRAELSHWWELYYCLLIGRRKIIAELIVNYSRVQCTLSRV